MKLIFTSICFNCSASLVLVPAYSEIESISFSRPDPSGISVTSYRHSIVSLKFKSCVSSYIRTYVNTVRIVLFLCVSM